MLISDPNLPDIVHLSKTLLPLYRLSVISITTNIYQKLFTKRPITI